LGPTAGMSQCLTEELVGAYCRPVPAFDSGASWGLL